MAAFDRLRALGDGKFTKIKNELMRGTPAMQLARTVQQEWNDFQDVAEKTLTQQLNRLRLAMVEGNFGKEAAEEVVKHAVVPTNLKVIRKIDKETIGCMDELLELAALQRKRVLRLAEKEEKMAVPFTPLNAIVNDYADLLLKIQKLRFDLGLDEFRGVLPTFKGVTASVTTPEGVSVQKQVYEAVGTVESIFEKRGIGM